MYIKCNKCNQVPHTTHRDGVEVRKCCNKNWLEPDDWIKYVTKTNTYSIKENRMSKLYFINTKDLSTTDFNNFNTLLHNLKNNGKNTSTNIIKILEDAYIDLDSLNLHLRDMDTYDLMDKIQKCISKYESGR